LAQKPLDVAVAGRPNALAAQRWTLASVARAIGLVALQAMLAIDPRSGRHRLRAARQRIHPRMIARRHLLPAPA
jgi:hypothetical protein